MVNVQESLANAKVIARQHCVYEAAEKKCTANQRKKHNVEKYTLNAVADNRGLLSPFYMQHLAVVASEICEILRKFEFIAVQGHPRSSILVSIESSYATFY